MKLSQQDAKQPGLLMGEARQAVNEPLLGASSNNFQRPNQGAGVFYHTLMNYKHHQQRASKMKTSPNKSTKFWTLTSITLLLLALFAWALYCRLAALNQNTTYTSHLKLVSLLVRHADRAPSDHLPPNDRHLEKPLFFWPNGLHNITETGRLRAYRTGLSVRRQYADFLDFDRESILVLSSPIDRCIESCQYLLRGLFDTGQSLKDSKAFYNHLAKCSSELSTNEHSCSDVPEGAGGSEEWRNIVIDSETLPSLSSYSLNKCRLLVNYSNPVDADALILPSISQLQGINLLEKVLRDRYNYTRITFEAITLWSTIKSELELTRTSHSLRYADHFQPWIFLEASRHQSSGHVISLFDLFERLYVVTARERLNGPRSRLHAGPILESIVRSQSVALGGTPLSKTEARYRDRKLVVYYSHDTVIQLLLWRLGVCREDPTTSFEDQYHKHFSTHQTSYKQDSELAPFLAGLKMSNYGISVELEMWELVHSMNPSKKFHTVHMNIYNRDDAKFHPVDHLPVPFGSMCRRLFLDKYPQGDLASFYDETHFARLDKSLSCPLNLFHNITADLLIDPPTYHSLCD